MEKPRLKARPDRREGVSLNGKGPIGILRPDSPESPTPQAVPPLKVKGVVVTRADLIEALRIYVPQLSDLQPFEDGEHFFLVFGTQSPGQS